MREGVYVAVHVVISCEGSAEGSWRGQPRGAVGPIGPFRTGALPQVGHSGRSGMDGPGPAICIYRRAKYHIWDGRSSRGSGGSVRRGLGTRGYRGCTMPALSSTFRRKAAQLWMSSAAWSQGWSFLRVLQGWGGSGGIRHLPPVLSKPCIRDAMKGHPAGF